MVIYTKRGDKGETGLFSKKGGRSVRTSKSSIRISAIGAIDEVNSYLGVVCSFSNDPVLIGELRMIQEELLTIGSILSGSHLRFYKTKTKRLEKRMDELGKKLPRLKNFILPGGTISASLLHYARTVTRRAERSIVALSEIEDIKPEILVYMNRLSDYLFMLARDQNHQAGVKEIIWKSK